MLMLHNQKICIMTLPKCATNSLHALFRRKKWDAETYVGPSTLGTNTNDRHTNRWPHEARRYKKFVTVRNPYNRLVSLYLHYTTREAGHGRRSPNFRDYVEQVVTNSDKLENWYKWNLTKWLEGPDGEPIQFDAYIRTEFLKDDLVKADDRLKVDNIPFLNKNYRAQKYEAFFTEEIMAMAGPWCQPDCEKFEYGPAPQPSPL